MNSPGTGYYIITVITHITNNNLLLFVSEANPHIKPIYLSCNKANYERSGYTYKNNTLTLTNCLMTCLKEGLMRTALNEFVFLFNYSLMKYF